MSELVRTIKSEDGMSTAEYALGTVAVAGIGGVIMTILKTEWFMELLKQVVHALLQAILNVLGLS